jgi:hypothetical protein
MIWLVATCLSLPLLLSSALVAGQQAEPGAKKPELKTSVNQSGKTTARSTTSHHPGRRTSKAAAHKSAKRPEYRPDYGGSSVEVINGDATKRVVFNEDRQTAETKSAPKAMKDAPSAMKVEVINGSSADTQYFYGNDREEQMVAGNQPVVVAVQSSNTRNAGGKKHTVVTSVNSAGAGDAKPAGSGGQPVTNSISPRPKRPAYQPDVP